jgi:transcriptional regulator with XRE-family HTH domain
LFIFPNMKERILLLIKAKNLTAAQFADEIGVQKSGVSHILSGRNNPSLDFVQKILIRFPELSTEWLIFGRGPMMLNDIPATFTLPPVNFPANTSNKFPDLFSQEITPVEALVKSKPIAESPESTTVRKDQEILPDYKTKVPEIQPETEKNKELATALPGTGLKAIEKIIVLYNDKSFAEYHPES